MATAQKGRWQCRYAGPTGWLVVARGKTLAGALVAARLYTRFGVIGLNVYNTQSGRFIKVG